MTSYANSSQSTSNEAWGKRDEAWFDSKGKHWPARAETWLDRKGKGAWIAAAVLGFIFFWPVGLALMIYMIWSKDMFSKNCTKRSRTFHSSFRSSGNTAFDAYKSDTLRRLQEEQDSFENFLERLRAAKDKNEFDQFMDERAKSAASEAPETPKDDTASA
jgi:predicted CopG family antitoxin